MGVAFLASTGPHLPNKPLVPTVFHAAAHRQVVGRRESEPCPEHSRRSSTSGSGPTVPRIGCAEARRLASTASSHACPVAHLRGTKVT